MVRFFFGILVRDVFQRKAWYTYVYIHIHYTLYIILLMWYIYMYIFVIFCDANLTMPSLSLAPQVPSLIRGMHGSWERTMPRRRRIQIHFLRWVSMWQSWHMWCHCLIFCGMKDMMIQLNENLRLNNHEPTFYSICTMLYMSDHWKLIKTVLLKSWKHFLSLL